MPPGYALLLVSLTKEGYLNTHEDWGTLEVIEDQAESGNTWGFKGAGPLFGVRRSCAVLR
jgi:hypothetical protein